MDAVERLYRLAPEEFVAARDELARQLKVDGDRDKSAAVKALRRPSVAAYAVNQVARSHRKEVTDLLAVADELRAAQQAALSGGDPEQLRKASRRRRELVSSLTEAALAVLARTGRDTKAQLPAISAIFDAAVANPGVASVVQEGRLVTEPEPAADDPFGFGATLDLTDAAVGRTRPSPRPKAAAAGPEPSAPAPHGQRVALRKAVGKAQFDHDRAIESHRDAESAVRKAQARADTADRELNAAHRRLDAAETATADAHRLLDNTIKQRDEAAALVDETAEILARTRQQLDRSG